MNRAALSKLLDRSYKTYCARIQAEKRLSALGNWWNAAQIALGAGLLSVSVAFLGKGPQVLPGGDILLAVLSVLSLVVSIVISNVDYGARRAEMFRSYRDIQELSVEAERLLDLSRWPRRKDVQDLSDRYQALLDTSPNHTNADHQLAQAQRGQGSVNASVRLRSAVPYLLPLLFVLGSVAMVAFVVARVILSGSTP